MRQALEGLKIKAFFAFISKSEATRASGARSLVMEYGGKVFLISSVD